MDTYFLLTILLFSFTYTTATFEDEIATLEKDIMNDSNEINIKKSINDLSTDELIAELEREFHTPKADSGEKKYRKRFEDIINKKAKLDKLANTDINSLLSKKEAADPLEDIIVAMSDSLDAKKRPMSDANGECKDTRSDCDALQSFCKTHKKKLIASCPKSCGYCVDCKQKVSVKTCSVLKRRGYCDDSRPKIRQRMIRLCPLTCDYCNVPSPPKCSETTHGCCWDKSTTKIDAHGKNCPACGNAYKWVCKTFKPDCESYLNPGEFMRRHCPKACGLCEEGRCEDSIQKAALCPFWKDTLNWCEEKEATMKQFCAKTCELC